MYNVDFFIHIMYISLISVIDFNRIVYRWKYQNYIFTLQPLDQGIIQKLKPCIAEYVLTVLDWMGDGS